jgi:hypothetical protein
MQPFQHGRFGDTRLVDNALVVMPGWFGDFIRGNLGI